MPTRQAHINQAEHNHEFWRQFDLTNTPYTDWIVVGMFYEAVHWIEAYLAVQSKHSGGHNQRQVSMAADSSLADEPHLVSDYGVLRTESEAARYRAQHYTALEIQNDLVPISDRLRETMKSLIDSGAL